MYDKISGVANKLASDDTSVSVITNSGISFHIVCVKSDADQYEHPSECTMFVHLIVKENELSLYGFINSEYREAFRLLIEVPGIGASTAMSILSAMAPPEVFQAIVSDDWQAFKAIKGIGEKTARQIIIDLQKKVAARHNNIKHDNVYSTLRSDSISALVSLGLSKREAEESAATGLSQGAASVSEVVKFALKS